MNNKVWKPFSKDSNLWSFLDTWYILFNKEDERIPIINIKRSLYGSSLWLLTLKAPTSQYGQTHSKNSSATADELFE